MEMWSMVYAEGVFCGLSSSGLTWALNSASLLPFADTYQPYKWAPNCDQAHPMLHHQEDVEQRRDSGTPRHLWFLRTITATLLVLRRRADPWLCLY